MLDLFSASVVELWYLWQLARLEIWTINATVEMEKFKTYIEKLFGAFIDTS